MRRVIAVRNANRRVCSYVSSALQKRWPGVLALECTLRARGRLRKSDRPLGPCKQTNSCGSVIYPEIVHEIENGLLFDQGN
jgi:hypothetical protein